MTSIKHLLRDIRFGNFVERTKAMQRLVAIVGRLEAIRLVGEDLAS